MLLCSSLCFSKIEQTAEGKKQRQKEINNNNNNNKNNNNRYGSQHEKGYGSPLLILRKLCLSKPINVCASHFFVLFFLVDISKVFVMTSLPPFALQLLSHCG